MTEQGQTTALPKHWNCDSSFLHTESYPQGSRECQGILQVTGLQAVESMALLKGGGERYRRDLSHTDSVKINWDPGQLNCKLVDENQPLFSKEGANY